MVLLNLTSNLQIRGRQLRFHCRHHDVPLFPLRPLPVSCRRKTHTRTRTRAHTHTHTHTHTCQHSTAPRHRQRQRGCRCQQSYTYSHRDRTEMETETESGTATDTTQRQRQPQRYRLNKQSHSSFVVVEGGGACGRRSLLTIPTSESHRRMPVKVRFHRRGRLSRQSPVSSQSDNPRSQGLTLRVHPRH